MMRHDMKVSNRPVTARTPSRGAHIVGWVGWWLVGAFWGLLALSAAACPTGYPAVVVKVVDGDTLDLRVNVGLDTERLIRVRVAGIDTPEMRGPEREAGRAAKAFVQGLVERVRSRVVFHPETKGRYGRWVGRVEIQGRDLSEVLLDAGHAEVYRPRP